jgi:hypothetical protein
VGVTTACPTRAFQAFLAVGELPEINNLRALNSAQIYEPSSGTTFACLVADKSQIAVGPSKKAEEFFIESV